MPKSNGHAALEVGGQRVLRLCYQLAELKTQELEAEQRLDSMRAKRRDIETELRAFVRATGKAAPAKAKASGELKRGEIVDKVRGFIASHKGTPVTLGAMKAQNWGAPPHRISNALSRLKNAGVVKHVGPGKWASA
jgi:hypothetical protein